MPHIVQSLQVPTAIQAVAADKTMFLLGLFDLRSWLSTLTAAYTALGQTFRFKTLNFIVHAKSARTLVTLGTGELDVHLIIAEPGAVLTNQATGTTDTSVQSIIDAAIDKRNQNKKLGRLSLESRHLVPVQIDGDTTGWDNYAYYRKLRLNIAKLSNRLITKYLQQPSNFDLTPEVYIVLIKSDIASLGANNESTICYYTITGEYEVIDLPQKGL